MASSDVSPPAVTGVAFPRTDGDKRSTTVTGRAVFADAARPVDARLAERIAAERDWHKRYLVHARELLEARLRSAQHSMAVPQAGLDSLHRRFVFARGGEDLPLAAAIAAPTGPAFDTVAITGEGERERELSVPYKGQRLRGDDLHRQLDRWVAKGTVEPSFAEAVRAVLRHPEWLDLSDRRVAIMGAGAEMGPLHSLSRWGATVLPVDLPHAALWQRILTTVRGGCGRALVPVRGRAAAADDDALAEVSGADLITDLPEVCAWLAAADGPLTLGNYVYADGAVHVQVAMAVDALCEHLTARRDDVSLAVLATPTDVFAVPEDAVAMAQERYAEGGLRRRLEHGARMVSRGAVFSPNYPGVITTEEGLRFGIADCLVAQQGPNYALAKRLQRWRASVARAQGTLASVNIAAPTRTRSVLKNRALAAAYAGARRFGIEVFDPSTSNTLMAALLVHDLRNTKAPAQPDVPLEHPLQLFIQGANHGGLWRNPFAPRSVLSLAVLLGMVQRGA